MKQEPDWMIRQLHEEREREKEKERRKAEAPAYAVNRKERRERERALIKKLMKQDKARAYAARQARAKAAHDLEVCCSR